MAIKIMTAVWDTCENLRGTHLVVLLALADFADQDDGGCWPSMSTIAQRARISPRRAQEVCRVLADQGYITITERPGKSNLIHVQIGVRVSAGVRNLAGGGGANSPRRSTNDPSIDPPNGDLSTTTTDPDHVAGVLDPGVVVVMDRLDLLANAHLKIAAGWLDSCGQVLSVRDMLAMEKYHYAQKSAGYPIGPGLVHDMLIGGQGAPSKYYADVDQQNIAVLDDNIIE